jgi:tetratricopeptide (TPR) repeat protein
MTIRSVQLMVLALVLAPALAAAQPRTADEWYKEGENQFILGAYEKAAEAFKQAFALETSESKRAAYLFNIAHAYRSAKDCTNALFFYKRFLTVQASVDTSKLPPAKKKQVDDRNREVEERIRELDECARNQEAIKSRPPDRPIKPEGTEGTEGKPEVKPKPDDVAIKPKPDDDTEEEEDGITKTAPPIGPRVISARLTGGIAKIKTGDLKVPVQATGALIAGYPIRLQDQVTLEVGAGFTFTPVPYQDLMGGSQSALLMALVANVGATYYAMPKLGIRGDVGVGGLFFSGLSESPFTENRPIEGGALSMVHVRVGVSAEWAFTPNIIGTLTPIAFSYSPAKEGLEESIKSITAIDVMVGLGYRM